MTDYGLFNYFGTRFHLRARSPSRPISSANWIAEWPRTTNNQNRQSVDKNLKDD